MLAVHESNWTAKTRNRRGCRSRTACLLRNAHLCGNPQGLDNGHAGPMHVGYRDAEPAKVSIAELLNMRRFPLPASATSASSNDRITIALSGLAVIAVHIA